MDDIPKQTLAVYDIHSKHQLGQRALDRDAALTVADRDIPRRRDAPRQLRRGDLPTLRPEAAADRQGQFTERRRLWHASRSGRPPRRPRRVGRSHRDRRRANAAAGRARLLDSRRARRQPLVRTRRSARHGRRRRWRSGGALDERRKRGRVVLGPVRLDSHRHAPRADDPLGLDHRRTGRPLEDRRPVRARVGRARPSRSGHVALDRPSAWSDAVGGSERPRDPTQREGEDQVETARQERRRVLRPLRRCAPPPGRRRDRPDEYRQARRNPGQTARRTNAARTFARSGSPPGWPR